MSILYAVDARAGRHNRHGRPTIRNYGVVGLIVVIASPALLIDAPYLRAVVGSMAMYAAVFYMAYPALRVDAPDGMADTRRRYFADLHMSTRACVAAMISLAALSATGGLLIAVGVGSLDAWSGGFVIGVLCFAFAVSRLRRPDSRMDTSEERGRDT